MRLWWVLWLHLLEGVPLSLVSRSTTYCEKWTLLATSTTTRQSASCSQAHSCHLHQWKLSLVHISWHSETFDSPSAPEHTQLGLTTKVPGFPSASPSLSLMSPVRWISWRFHLTPPGKLSIISRSLYFVENVGLTCCWILNSVSNQETDNKEIAYTQEFQECFCLGMANIFYKPFS